MAPLFLITTIDGEEWSVSRPGGIHWFSMLSGPESQSGHFGVKTNLFPPAENRTLAVQNTPIGVCLCKLNSAVF
jgi:hypothetical protein